MHLPKAQIRGKDYASPRRFYRLLTFQTDSLESVDCCRMGNPEIDYNAKFSIVTIVKRFMIHPTAIATGSVP